MADAVLDWLKRHGLEGLAPTLAAHEVDLATLGLLDEADLKELGIPLGPRKRLLRTIAESARPDPVVMAERRHVTALFCDIVGFTGLSRALDPEDLEAIVRRYEDACSVCVTRYEGYVYRKLGDGIAALFGYPLAHENEAERAIRAGLDIVEAVERLELAVPDGLQVRVGIASGVVVVDSAERNIVGDALNVAARLQAEAEPGTVIVTDTVRRLARGAFEYAAMGDLTLKGIPTPVTGFRALGSSAAATRFDAAQRSLTAMVGREKEHALLLDRWQMVEHHRTGQAVVLSGEPGIGKSRLLNAIRADLGRRGVRRLLFQCSPFHVNSAWRPVAAALERALEFRRGEAAEARLDKLERFVAQRTHRPAMDARFLAAMLSIPYQERYGAITLPARAARDETVRLLVEAIADFAVSQPGMLLFEDVHWADPSTLGLIDAILSELHDIPLLAVLTHRPDMYPDWERHPGVTALELHKLTSDESGRLVRATAPGHDMPDELVQRISERAEGVPLFIEELTRAIVEADEDGRVMEAAASLRAAVPETLTDLLMARLDQSAAARRVAQIASVIGREFPYELLASLGFMPEAELREALSELVRLDLVQRRGQVPDAVFTFRHALVQDAARNSLLRRERRRIHGQIARTLERHGAEDGIEPEILARHYTEAGLPERAVAHWKHAGEVAIERFALAEAIAYLRRGLEVAGSLPAGEARDLAELELRTMLGPLLMAQHGWAHPEIAAALEPAWTLAEALDHRQSFVRILNSLSVHYFSAGDVPGSLRTARRLLRAGAGARDETMVIAGHRAAGATHFWRGDFARALRHGDLVHRMYDAERHWHIAQMTNTDPFTGEGIYRGQFLWMLGFPDRARAASDAKDANARRRMHPFDLAFALTLGAQLFEYLHEPDELLRRTEEADRVGREHGLTLLSGTMVEISRGNVLLRSGRFAEAARQLDMAISRLEATGHRIWISYLRALHAEALSESGNPAAALEIVDASLGRLQASEERAHHAEVLRIKASILARCGEKKAAERLLEASIRVARAQNARSWELRSATSLASLLAERGEPETAHQVLAPVYAWFSEGLATHDLRKARELLDSLACQSTR